MTTIPRWTLAPVAGEAVHDAAVPPAVAAGLRRLADEAGVPITAVLLAAHAKVLAALSGEREVVTGYVRGGRIAAVPADHRARDVAGARGRRRSSGKPLSRRVPSGKWLSGHCAGISRGRDAVRSGG